MIIKKLYQVYYLARDPSVLALVLRLARTVAKSENNKGK